MQKFFLLFFVACVLLPACKKNIGQQITEIEQSQNQSYSEGRADTLLSLYQQAIQEYPKKHSENLQFSTKAAEIKFARKDHVGAVRLLNDALKNYGKDQDLTEPVALLSRIWLAYKYRSTSDLSSKPDDLDRMHANLLKNKNWLDSSLVRLEKIIGTAPHTNKKKAEIYIQIAESYSRLLEVGSPDKYSELIFKAAKTARALGETGKAMQLYHQIGERIPWHPKAPAALLEMARLYENDLKNAEKAKETYREIVRLYPKNTEFVPIAEAALKSLEATQ
ncbi:MAG: hypothetical protein OHK0019_32050 [Saprospiraceae bacterium]